MHIGFTLETIDIIGYLDWMLEWCVEIYSPGKKWCRDAECSDRMDEWSYIMYYTAEANTEYCFYSILAFLY